MALAKRVKVGGSFFKGYKLSVLATPGDYILDMALSGRACAVNGITVTPDKYGSGDYFKLEHYDSTGAIATTLLETVFNIGAGISLQFDFSALEAMLSGSKLRLTYSNVAGTALNVYTIVERIR